MAKDVLFTDIEVYHDYFYVGFKRLSDGRRVGMELSRRSPNLNRDGLMRILKSSTIVTYNGLTYDMPLLILACKHDTTNKLLKEKSDTLIQDHVRWWDAAKVCGVWIPRDIDHIDLIETQPNANASLKILNGRLHGKRLQDLPFDPAAVPTDEQMDVLTDYCLNSDTDATENVFNALRAPLELREYLGKEYGEDFRSKSDAQIGEAIAKKRVEQITGRKAVKAGSQIGMTFHYPVPEFLKFQTPELQEILEKIRATEFRVNSKGKVDLPKWLNDTEVTIGNSIYSIGIGGLHSKERQRAVFADEDYILVDADVASQYPNIIMALGLFPKALGRDFLTVYRNILDERLAAKRAKDKAKDKGLKIALNGIYGKLGSPYSILNAPHLLASVTLTGQLTLLMLIEMAEAAGVEVLSGNTDGVMFRCPRSMYAGIDEKSRLLPSALEEITTAWETATTFSLEFGEYKALFNQSVNDYIALKTDGGHKRIGRMCKPWSKDPSDYDARKELMKNPLMAVCSDAALAKMKFGTPVEETIRACTDMRDFVTVVKVEGGGMWRGEYLGKVVRFYWATDGEEILYSKAHETTGNHKKVANSEGCAPCMDLPDVVPGDLDYDHYIREAEDILTASGFYGAAMPPMKRIRITKANRVAVLSAWAVAA